MYVNLQTEMNKKNISVGELAEFLDMKKSSVRNKINGKGDFNLIEAMRIKVVFFPGLTMSYLFEPFETNTK